MTTTTLVGTPDPDNPDEGRVLPFPARPTDTPPADSDRAQDAVPAGPDPDEVVNGDLVNDDEDASVLVDQPAAPVPVDDRPLPERLADLTQARRPILPAWLRHQTELTAVLHWAAGHVGHVAAFHAVRCPLYAGRLAWRAPRGLVRTVAHLVGWVFDLEGAPLRADAVAKGDQDGYLRLVEARRQRVRNRLLIATVAAVVATAGVLVLAGWTPVWAQDTALALVIGLLGWIGTPQDKAVLGTRAVVTHKAQKLTSDIVVRALSALGIGEINKAVKPGGGGITFPAPITRDGPGWRAEVDLPYGVTVADVMDKRDSLASGLRRPVGCVWPEPAHDQHAGRLVLWVGDQDMAKATPKPWPLAKAGTADLFKPVPFGTDPRGRLVGLELMFTNVLIGAMPGAGKTFALRVLLLAAALDITSQLWLFELKGSGDLDAFEAVAHRYASGPDDATIEATLEALREIKAELFRRIKTIGKLPRELRPENKVTPELAARRHLGLFPLVVAIDECQNLFSHPEFGKEAGQLATDIIKLGRAFGVILLLATQRPDKASLPTGISANVGVRFCLRVMDQTANDMVLGTSMYQAGIRATQFSKHDKGIGYLVGASDDPQITRSAYVDGPAAERIIARARAAREHAGTLSGHAIGDTPDADTPASSRRSVLDEVAGVFGPDEDRLWSEVVLARLTAADREHYQGWSAHALAAALKPYGVTPVQVAMRADDGTDRNRRGYRLDALRAALAERGTPPNVDAE